MARLFALVFGALYLLGGVVGFFLPTPFLGTFEVNVAHNVLHIAVGAFWIGAAALEPFGPNSARIASAAMAIVFLILAVIGFLIPEQLDAALRINLNDNLLHLATGALAGWVGFMTEPQKVSPKTA